MHKDLIKAFYAAMNNREFEDFQRFFHKDYVSHRVGRQDLVGYNAAVENWLLKFLGAHTDVKFSLYKVAEESDTVFVYSRVESAAHTRVVASIFRIEDSKIAEYWDVEQDDKPLSEGPAGTQKAEEPAASTSS